MKRTELEKFLGKMVCIDTLFHKGTVLCGELHKNSEECFKNNTSLYYAGNNYYFVTLPGTLDCASYLFRCSHVRKVKRVHNSNEFWFPYGKESEWEKSEAVEDETN